MRDPSGHTRQPDSGRGRSHSDAGRRPHPVVYTAGIASNTGHLLGARSQSSIQRGELVRYVRDLSDQEFIRIAEESTREFEQLLNTLDLGNAEAVRALLDELLDGFAMKIRSRLDAERVTVFLVNSEKGHAAIQDGALEEGGKSMEIEDPRIGSGIAGQVARTGETLNVADAYSHPAFNRDVDAKTGFRTKSILCMPIKDTQDRVFAVAQLLNKKSGTAFSVEDEHRFNEFSNALGLIVESWIRLRHR